MSDSNKINFPASPEHQVKILEKVLEGLKTFPLQGSQAQQFVGILQAVEFVKNSISTIQKSHESANSSSQEFASVPVLENVPPSNGTGVSADVHS